MAPLDQKLLEISIEALAKHKKEIDDTKVEIDKTNKKVSEVKDSLKSDIGKLSNNLLTIDKNIPNLVKEEVAKIPKPKDGAPGKDGKSIVGPKGKDGKDGKSIVGPRGVSGKDGKSIKGDKGKDGVGIVDIYKHENSINIKLTDGKVKSIKLPELVQVVKDTPTSYTYPFNRASIQLKHLRDVNIDNAKDGDILTRQGDKWVTVNSVDGLAPITNRVQLEAEYNFSFNSAYKEFIYDTDNKLLNVNIYSTSSKEIILFIKTINYDANNLITSIVIQDASNLSSLLKVFTYSGDKIESITSTYVQ